MYSPASFETAYVQRASPTEPPLVTCVSSTRYARVPNTSLVEKSTSRSSVVPMKPAPPVISSRLPCNATRRVYPRLERAPVADLAWTQWTFARFSGQRPAFAFVEPPGSAVGFEHPEHGLGGTTFAHRVEC